MYINRDRNTIFDADGGPIVYKAQRAGYDGEHWFVSNGLDPDLEIAAKNAIFSLSGVPDAAVLMERIQLQLAGMST
jgi:hypothetical protein